MKKNSGLQHIVFERDSYTCILCNGAASDMHHIIKRSQGGKDHPHNLVSLCRVHHDLVHGTIWNGVQLTKAEAEQTIMEYICDYYAMSIQKGNWWGP